MIHTGMRWRWMAPVSLYLLGCGSSSPSGLAALDSSINPADGATSVGDAVQNGDGGQTDAATAPTLALSIGPIPLAAGQERTICRRFRLPATTAINVVQMDATLAPGSHHLVFYRSVAKDERLDLYDCPPLDPSDGRSAPPSGGFPDQDVPIFIAETANHNTLPLPKGVAYHFDAGQMVRLEAHYLNASVDAIQGQGQVSLTLGQQDDYQPADIMFCGSVQPLLAQGASSSRLPGLTGMPPYGLSPNQETDLPWQFMSMPPGIQMFGITSHQHKRGIGMHIEKSTAAETPGTVLVDSPNWDDPQFKIFAEAPLTFADGVGLRWQCKYNNQDATMSYFGQSAQTDEMCFFWAYYYPSVGSFISLGYPGCWQ